MSIGYFRKILLITRTEETLKELNLEFDIKDIYKMCIFSNNLENSNYY